MNLDVNRMVLARSMLALGFALGTSPLAAAPLPVEPWPTVDAAVLAPAALLNGNGYTVDAKVPVLGYMGQFTMRAPAGVFAADGTEMLAIRVAELAAIAELSRMSQSSVFTEALAASAVKTGTAIGQAVLNPIGTLSGIPAGVGRFFTSAETTISRATEARGANSESSADAANDLLGINKAKRRIAKQVGADPYTTNPVLAKQLDDLARAAFAGGVSLDVALTVSTAGVATAVSATARVSDLVWERSPKDIRTAHEQKLAAMGVRAEAITAFVTNRWLTPTLSVPLVERLAALPSGAGRSAVIELTSTVASEGEARFMLNAITMASRMNTTADPVVAVDLAGRIMAIRTRGGRVNVPAPVDYIVWTESVRAFAAKESRRAGRTIVATGIASPVAREGLTAAGWTVQEHSAR